MLRLPYQGGLLVLYSTLLRWSVHEKKTYLVFYPCGEPASQCLTRVTENSIRLAGAIPAKRVIVIDSAAPASSVTGRQCALADLAPKLRTTRGHCANQASHVDNAMTVGAPMSFRPRLEKCSTAAGRSPYKHVE